MVPHSFCLFSHCFLSANTSKRQRFVTIIAANEIRRACLSGDIFLRLQALLVVLARDRRPKNWPADETQMSRLPGLKKKK